jgi:hypothetical protein
MDHGRKIRISLGSDVQLTAPTGKDLTPRMKKTRGLVAYAALAPGLSVPRDAILRLLWSDRSAEQARNSLRQSLHEARMSLGADGDVLTSTRNAVGLRPERCEIDVSVREDTLAALEGCDPKFDEWLRTTRRACTRPEVLPGASPPTVTVISVPAASLGLEAADRWVWGLRSSLARARWLHVIIPELVPVQTGSRSKYVVRVAVRGGANGSRVWVELVETASGRVLWTEAAPSKEGLAVADDELAVLAHVIESMIALEESRQLGPVAEARLGGHGLIHRAVGALQSMTPEGIARAQRLLSRAIEVETDSAGANAYYAFTHVFRVGQGAMSDLATARESARFHARRATELAPDDGWSWAVRGHVESFLCQNATGALPWFDRALTLQPSSAIAWSLSAAARCYVGDSQTALRHANRAHQLELAAPGPLAFFSTNIRAIACSAAGDYENAVRIAREVLLDYGHFIAAYPPLLTSLGHLGQVKEAERCTNELREHMPDVSLSLLGEIFPLVRRGRAYLRGLEKAGIPRA